MQPDGSNYQFNPAPTNRRRQLIILSIVLLGILLIVLVSYSFLVRPFISIIVPAGADSVRMTHANSDGTITTYNFRDGRHRVTTGTYSLAAYKGTQAVGYSTVNVHAGLTQKITLVAASATGSLSTVMHQHADLFAPLGSGYVYVDNATRGVYYGDGTTTKDISRRLLLSQTDPTAPGFTGTYSTVIAMQPISNGALLVTTTTAVYVVNSPSDISRFPAYTKDYLYYTSSSYDASNHRLFVLAANRREIFYYDTTKADDGPQILTKAPRDINRVTAGGGKVAVLYDDVPSLEPSVLSAFAINRQLAPIVIDGTSGKTIKIFKDWQGSTLASVSPDGNYLVLKKKFATRMTILSLEGKDDIVSVSPDTNAFAWQGNSLYFGRGNSLWSISPSTTGASLQLLSGTSAPIIRIVTSSDTVLALTNAYFVARVVNSGTADSSAVQQLIKTASISADYFIAFTATRSGTHIDIETPGYTNALDDAAVAAAKSDEFNRARAAIQPVLGQPGITLAQRDTSITTPFENAEIPTDEGGNSIDQ